MQRTTRERIADRLRGESLSAPALAAAFELSTATVIDHVEHIARSLDDSDEQLLVAPPTCADCDFDEFDDRLNEPSRCPKCHSENISSPVFRIE